jgi:hypothetical protein
MNPWILYLLFVLVTAPVFMMLALIYVRLLLWGGRIQNWYARNGFAVTLYLSMAFVFMTIFYSHLSFGRNRLDLDSSWIALVLILCGIATACAPGMILFVRNADRIHRIY